MDNLEKGYIKRASYQQLTLFEFKSNTYTIK